MSRTLLARAARALSVLIAVLAFTLAGTAFAQTDVTTSRVSGTVKDADGGALPGVSIEGKNQDTGLVQNATTNQQGFYQLVNLPTGSYTITATLAGFKTATTENVRLLLGSTPSVNFTLQLGAVAETITVTSAVPFVEVTNTSASRTIQTEQIRNLPINGRNFTQLVTLTPTVAIESQRGYVQISGQRAINTNITVDGVDFNDAFFGGPVGSAEGRSPLSISQESIKEFTVIVNGASVEFGRSAGGFVNVITKSGTNDFHGSGFYYYQPQEWIADFADGREPADQEKKQFGASLGGPILKDRLFFFASYDQQDQSLTVPINPLNLDPAVFARYPVLASPDTYAQTRDANVLFGRLDFQVGAAQRLMVRGNFTEYDGLNGTSDGQNRTESYNGVEGMKTDSYVVSHSSQFGGSLLNDLNLNYVEEDTPREDKGRNLVEIRQGAFRYGEVAFLPIVSTSKRKAVGDTVTLLLQSHVFKAGGEYNDTEISQVFKGNWRGIFFFNTPADLVDGRWSRYQQFGGLGGLTADEAGALSYGQEELALFLQDQWFLNPLLTITAGVRWERLDNPDNPVLNPRELNPDGSFALNAQIPDSDNQFSPRLGISWSPDRKSVVRLSAGRFWSRTPSLIFSQLITSNGLRGTQYNIFAPTSGGVVTGPPTDPLSPGWGAAFNPEGVEQINFTQLTNIPPRPGVAMIDPDFENPYTDRVTLGYEREILPLIGAGIELTYAESKQLQRLKDINREYDGTIGPNGLPRYSNSVFPYPYYGIITTSVSDARSEFFAATASLQRRFADGFSAGFNATYSRDRDTDSNERNFAGIQMEDYNDPEQSFAYSDRDQRWRLSANGVWETPWWAITLSGAIRYSTGRPYNATTNADDNRDGQSTTDRPTVGGEHFERNAFRQPDFYSLDARLGKAFRIGPGDLQLFIECFNCTDAANRSVLNTTWGTGQTPISGFGAETGVGTPRTFQVAARYDF